MNCHYLSVPYDIWLSAIWFVTGLLNWPAALAPVSSRLFRLAAGRYKPSLHRSRAHPLRGYTSVNWGVRFVNLSSKNPSHIDVCFFCLCAYSNITNRTGWWRGKKGKNKERKNRKCGMAALFGMVVDSLWQEGSIQYMLPPLAWLKRGMDEGWKLNNFIPWIIRG